MKQRNNAVSAPTSSILSVGFVIASIVPTTRCAQPTGAVILYPMIALSGLFVPVKALAPVLHAVALALPPTYAVNLLTGIWNGDGWRTWIREAELFKQSFPIDRFLLISRSPEVDSLPNSDPLLQLRLLQLHTDPLLQFVNLAIRVESETVILPRSGLRRPPMHSIVVVFPASLGPIKPNISPSLTLKDASATATTEP